MNDLEKVIELLEKNNINYRQTPIYGEDNSEGVAIWLDVGHIEFEDNMIHNIVTY